VENIYLCPIRVFLCNNSIKSLIWDFFVSRADLLETQPQSLPLISPSTITENSHLWSEPSRLFSSQCSTPSLYKTDRIRIQSQVVL